MNWADILFGLGSAATAGAAEAAQMELMAQQEAQRRQDIEWQKRMAEQQFALQQQAQQTAQEQWSQEFALRQQQFEFNKQMVLEQLNLEKNRNLLEAVLNVSQAMRQAGVSDPVVAKGVLERLGYGDVSDDLAKFVSAGAAFDKVLMLMKSITDESEIPEDLDEQMKLILKKAAQLNRYAVRLQEQAVQKGDIELQAGEQQLRRLQAELSFALANAVLEKMAELGDEDYKKLQKDGKAFTAFVQQLWNSPLGDSFKENYGDVEGLKRLENTVRVGLSIPPVITKRLWLESQVKAMDYAYGVKMAALQHRYQKDLALFGANLQRWLADSGDPLMEADEWLKKRFSNLRRFGLRIPSLGLGTNKELGDEIAKMFTNNRHLVRRMSGFVDFEPIADFWKLPNEQLANVVVRVNGEPKTLQMLSAEANDGLTFLLNFKSRMGTGRVQLTENDKNQIKQAADKIYAFITGRDMTVLDLELSQNPKTLRAIPSVRDRALVDDAGLVGELMRHMSVPQPIIDEWKGGIPAITVLYGRQSLGVPSEVSNEAQRRSMERGQQERLQRNQQQPSSVPSNSQTANPLRLRRYEE